MKNEKVLKILQEQIDKKIDEFNSFTKGSRIEKRAIRIGDIFYSYEVDADYDLGSWCGYVEHHNYYKLLEHNNKLYMIECEEDGTLLTYGAKITEYHSLNDHKVQELKDFISDLTLIEN